MSYGLLAKVVFLEGVASVTLVDLNEGICLERLLLLRGGSYA